MSQPAVTSHQAKYLAWLLTRRGPSDSVESMGSALMDAQIDLNPHQVEAALFALKNPLSRGVILADEVGLGKTIEAGLVILQRWAERRRKILIVVPANLRKQWHQELQDKFGLSSQILEAKSFNVILKRESRNPFDLPLGPIICSYQFIKSKADEVKSIPWDLVIFDEAHRLRNVYKSGNVIARSIKESLASVHSKVLLTATPLQNSLLELYGLVSIVDEQVFGDLESFRAQYSGASNAKTLETLRQRMTNVFKRTLRRQVRQYVPFTSRRAIVQEFVPSFQEKRLSELVGNYLRRSSLRALPGGQRQLISLVLWKLLASSSHAIAGALETMATRLLDSLKPTLNDVPLEAEFGDDYEALEGTTDEWTEPVAAPAGQFNDDRLAIQEEADELLMFRDLARSIQEDSKGEALLTALDQAFQELGRLGGPQKAIIFTESKRTQQYLLTLLSETKYGNNIVLFNGTNSDERAQEVYSQWLLRHGGTDRISGSKSADTRAALVEHFQDHGTIMIATEAGAEGINLQFCSLVINYDLPWNPQRIEQRIGRCHRYGQAFDVVVVNFIDRTNEADSRVYDILCNKFRLFEGVFGASDEVLGAIGSGVDFERRIAEIYRTCREPAEIKGCFEQLQRDLSSEIDEAMLRTRQILLEHFDEEVQEKLRLSAEASNNARDKFEEILMTLTVSELGPCAVFGECGFSLEKLPSSVLETSVQLGRYELPNSGGHGHLYRVGHPLAEWVISQAKSRRTPRARLVFDYDLYGAQVSTLKSYKGKCGWLTVVLLTVETLGNEEQHLIVAAITSDGQELLEQDPEKLLRLPAREVSASNSRETINEISSPLDTRRQKILAEISKRNLDYFDQEVQKLDAWADDVKLGQEQKILEIDREIKDVRRAATTAPTLAEKLEFQKRQKELDQRRRRFRQEMFSRQDQLDTQRDELISALEGQLEQQVREDVLFTTEWELK